MGVLPSGKQTFQEVWAAEEEWLLQAQLGKFRDREHITQYAFREWQKLTGNFVPTNTLRSLRYFNVESTNDGLTRTLRNQQVPILCINDANHAIDFQQAKQEINQAFETILPEKCSFEK